MRFTWLISLLLASMAVAQTAPTKPAASTKPAGSAAQKAPMPDDDDDEAQAAKSGAAAAAVPADAPVITIKGVCADKTAVAASCQTVLTRAQFEKLADAIQPNMPPQVKRQLANAYPRLLVMAQEAEKRGLDKQPRFEETLKFARLQILSQELNRTLQAQAADVPDQDMQDYYKSNAPAYEEATVLRVFVPKNKQVEPAKGAKPEDTKAAQEAGEAAMTKEADVLYTRAKSGEDFEKLQKEAYEAAGLKSPAPSTKMEKIRRTNLPPAQATVFDLKPSELSTVINDPSGHFIYKMVSKDTLPFEKVKDEIHGSLQNQRMKDTMGAITAQATPELNQAYFGAAPPPGMPMGGAGPRPGTPPGTPPPAPPKTTPQSK
jgi:hypothetical protein